jgi:protein-tyrosine phosphatase
MNTLQKGFNIVSRRIKMQGLRTTLIWAYGRGLPKLTGIPMAKYSRITRQIYVGPQYRQRGKRHLARLGITGVVNMRVEYDDAAHNLLVGQYCHLPTIDDDAPTVEYLNAGIAFIEQVIAAGGKVYIHCAGGIGRAPTMAVAYFVRHGLSVDDAINLIKQTRPFINITPVQMEHLRRFERAQLEAQQETGYGSRQG